MSESVESQLLIDLKKCLKNLKWNVNGVHLKSCKTVPYPKSPQAVAAMLEDLAKMSLIPMLKEKFDCEIEEGGAREYPDLTVKIAGKMYAIDIKTTRLEEENKVKGFTLGTYTGYFLHPDEKTSAIKYPYSSYDGHIVCGIIYKWQEGATTEDMVKIVDIIVQPKWKIASKRTGTGTTRHIKSVTELERLRLGRGDFESEEDFEKYWREKGRNLEERQKKRRGEREEGKSDADEE